MNAKSQSESRSVQTSWGQVNLQFLFFLTAISAVLVAVWLARPPAELTIRLNNKHQVQLNGQSVPPASLADELKKRVAWRRIWLRESNAKIETTGNIPAEMMNQQGASGINVIQISFYNPGDQFEGADTE